MDTPSPYELQELESRARFELHNSAAPEERDRAEWLLKLIENYKKFTTRERCFACGKYQ